MGVRARVNYFMFYYLDTEGGIRGAAARSFESSDQALDQARMELSDHPAVEIWMGGQAFAVVRRSAGESSNVAA
jgi:hypothetical protein